MLPIYRLVFQMVKDDDSLIMAGFLVEPEEGARDFTRRTRVVPKDHRPPRATFKARYKEVNFQSEAHNISFL